MKKALYILVFLCCYLLHGQKVVRKLLSASHYTNIHINAAHCFEVVLETTDSKEIEVEANMEGEHTLELLVHVEREESTVTISTGFQPYFNAPGDKLNVHKVLSVRLLVKVPKHRYVHLSGTGADCTITGSFANLNVVLDDGNCTVYALKTNAQITTQSGQIAIQGSAAKVSAISKYGVVTGTMESSNAYLFKLSTISGNIHLIKTK